MSRKGFVASSTASYGLYTKPRIFLYMLIYRIIIFKTGKNKDKRYNTKTVKYKIITRYAIKYVCTVPIRVPKTVTTISTYKIGINKFNKIHLRSTH